MTARGSVQVTGRVRTVSMPACGNTAQLVAEVSDGDRTVHLVWMGRRRVCGVEPGVMLQASGCAATRAGVETIYNPAYEIIGEPEIPTAADGD